MKWLHSSIGVLVATVMTSCAPASPSGQGGRVQPDQVAERQPRTLVMGTRYEAANLTSKNIGQPKVAVTTTTRLFNAELDIEDGQGVARPYLAEAVPQLNTESWRVFADGRMETTYRLRPNLTWHDGAALTADDFVFSWQVYSTPELGASRTSPLHMIEGVVAPDKRTLAIRWLQVYPDAGALRMDFQALPRHILAEPFHRLDPDAFLNLPYWTHGYVHAERVALDLWGDMGSAFEKELTVLAHGWQRAGFETRSIYFPPPAQARDSEKRASFSSLYDTSSKTLEGHTTATIPTAANRWNGQNLGAWSNAEYDRLWATFLSTLDQPERVRSAVQMMKLISEQLPAWVLYFDPSVMAHLSVVRGPDSATDFATWNIHAWELR